MPYIQSSARNDYWKYHLPDAGAECCGPGELNFVITEIIRGYRSTNPGYQGINDIVGALEGCKLEFYRRVVVPYEDKKIFENGDVYAS